MMLFLMPPATGGAASQESLRAEGGISFGRLSAFTASPDVPYAAASVPVGDVLGSCPKSASLSLEEAYQERSGLKDVSEVSSGVIPLPVDDLDKAGLLAALRNNLSYWQGKPDSFKVSIGKDSFSSSWMSRTTQQLIDLFSSDMSPAALRSALESRFRIYRSVADDGTGKVVITGYYEAEIKAVRTPDAVNRFPIYLRPADLIKTTPDMGVDFDYGRRDESGVLVRHYPREEISGGALDGKGLELAWSEHPAWIMLLQIQGSGVLRFPDGDSMKVGFNGANGWPFKSVQKILTDCGEVAPMSFKKFIDYLTTQGDRESRLVDLNPRYVYFQSRPKDSPAYGAMGVGLVPGRSIAVDPAPIPLGVTALLSSRRPVAASDGSLSFRDFTRFVVAQDTGAAIRGPGRIDLFWGGGDTAFTEASSMKAPGDLYIFVAK